jgi:hypothetical protein
VHHLVLLAFKGPCPKGMEARHLDGDPSNNKISNLRWGTPKKNMQDRDKHGKTKFGEDHWYCKLTSKQVDSLKKDRKNGMSRKRTADKYRVSETYVSLVTNGKCRVRG